MTISAGDAQWKITGDTSELDAALQEASAGIVSATGEDAEYKIGGDTAELDNAVEAASASVTEATDEVAVIEIDGDPSGAEAAAEAASSAAQEAVDETMVQEFDGDTSGLDSALDDVANQADATATAVAASADDINNSLSTIGQSMTVAGAAITAGLGFAVKGFADYAETIDTVSKKTGFSTDAIQEWKFAAEQSSATIDDVTNAYKFMVAGIDAGTMSGEKQAETIKGLQDDYNQAAAKLDQMTYSGKASAEQLQAQYDKCAELAQKLQDTSTQSEGAAKAFQTLGLSADQLKSMQPEAAFEKILYALAEVPEQMDRTSLAQDIFGRGAMALAPLMAEGSAGIAALKQEAQDLGLVMSGESIIAGEAFGDEMAKLGSELKMLGMSIAQALLPTLKDLVASIAPVVQDMTEWIQAHPALISGIVAVGGAVGAFMVTLGPLLMMLPGLATLFSAIGVVAGALAGVLAGPVIAAIGAVVLAGVVLYEFWDEIAAAGAALWDGLKAAFEAGGEAVAAVWEWMVDAGQWTWDMLTGGFSAVADAAVGIFTGVADFFKGLWNGIVGIFETAWDIIRGIVNAVISGVNSVMSAAAMLPGVPELQLPFLAEGGPAQAGQPYLVGERGPEMFIPSESGTVQNASNTGGGGVTLNVNINGPVNANNGQDIRKLSEDIAAVTVRELRAAGMMA